MLNFFVDYMRETVHETKYDRWATVMAVNLFLSTFFSSSIIARKRRMSNGLKTDKAGPIFSLKKTLFF